MNKESLRKIISSDWLPPALMFVIGALNIAFAEKLPANEGLGWDGAKYASMARDLLSSPDLDAYYIMRIFPSALIHVFFNVFNIPFGNQNIVIGFELLDLVSLTTAVFVIKKIFNHLKIDIEKQLLGFILFIISYSILVYSFYYPVMTDAFALLLSVLMLYFFLCDQPLNIVLVGFMGGFTIPVLLYQSILLVIFPVVKERVYVAFSKRDALIISVFSSLYILFVAVYYAIYKQADSEMLFTLKMSRPLLPISILCVVALYFFFPRMIFNKYLFSRSYVSSNIHINRILFAAVLFLMAYVFKYLVYPEMKPSEYYNIEHFIKVFPVQALVRPLISIVSDANYFGIIIILLMLFWTRFCRTVSSYGLGLALAFLLPVYLVGMTSEPRIITILFPWLVIFWIKSVEEVRFSSAVYWIFFSLNFIISKIWLSINYDLSCGTDESGTIAFPNQKFFMHMGTWMSEQMWLLLLVGFSVVFGLVAFTLKRFSDIFSRKRIYNS